MSDPILSIGSREILRALAIGIELRGQGEEWKFVGPWQDDATSRVAADHVSELLDAGFARPTKPGRVEITERGRQTLASITRSIIDEGMRWLHSKRRHPHF